MDQFVILPPQPVLLTMLYAAAGLIVFLVLAGALLALLTWLIGVIFEPRRPKPEIVPNGLVIFDV